MNTKFGDWLVDQMVIKGWSQAELARRSGLSRQAISHFVNGTSTHPSTESISKLSYALNIPDDTIMRATGMKQELTERAAIEEVLRYKLGELSDDELEDILEYIDYKLQRLERNEKINLEGTIPSKSIKRQDRTPVRK